MKVTIALLVLGLSMVTARELLQALPPSVRGLGPDKLATASSTYTSAAIQQAADGGSATKATNTGAVATSIVSASSGLNPIINNPDTRSEAMSTQVSAGIGQAAGGTRTGVANAGQVATAAQILSTGTKREQRVQASQQATQAAVQSGSATGATKVGADMSQRSGGASNMQIGTQVMAATKIATTVPTAPVKTAPVAKTAPVKAPPTKP